MDNLNNLENLDNLEKLENMENMDNLDIHTVLHCITQGPREKCGCNRLQSGNRDVKDKKYVVDADKRKAKAFDKCMQVLLKII